MQIMFVCMGNVCRSPTAEVITRHLLADTDSFVVLSTGLLADVGNPMDPGSLSQISAHGLNGTAHVAQQTTWAQIVDSDIIVALDRAVHSTLRRQLPEDLWFKLRVMTEFDTTGTFGDVVNPWRCSPEVYSAVYDQIERSCRGVVAALPALVA